MSKQHLIASQVGNTRLRPYDMGSKRCLACRTGYIETPKIFCPGCGMKYRTTPRDKRTRNENR